MELVTWPPILHGDPEETAEFTRRMLQNCQDYHAACRLREPNWEHNLPSRVLSITESIHGISVSLAESQGLSGRYCALSHCWGPEDKRPLRTNRSNYQGHLASIPWDDLPPLFQDAITLTKSIGISYLWIDSLCILQDDRQDWLEESKKMALVYHRATLVIAAVDSEDSTQRLSKAQRPEPLVLRVPYSVHEMPVQGSYNIAPSIFMKKGVQGPLRERAWAFQEFYLARRKVLFTSEGLGWACVDCQAQERAAKGDEIHLYETLNWLTCLEYYSAMQLTFPSDRLTALLGIVAQMGESRNDRFVSELGVWEDHLANQLLWKDLTTTDEDLPDLPSWSWAATGGGKQWLATQDPHEVLLNKVEQSVNLKESGSLSASGLLIRVTTASRPLEECCTGVFATRRALEDWILPGYFAREENRVRFPILNPDGTSSLLGLAVFDRFRHYSECFSFILASSSRELDDPWYEGVPDF